MATRGNGIQSVGSAPPQLSWTLVRGDTPAFKVYVTDDAKQPLNIPDWTIDMEIKRPTNSSDAGIITDNATIITTLTPTQDADDAAGEFTVKLTASQSTLLETGDIFDIELSLPQNETVWTVAQGSITVIEDVTN
jgi:hypothetical protein